MNTTETPRQARGQETPRQARGEEAAATAPKGNLSLAALQATLKGRTAVAAKKETVPSPESTPHNEHEEAPNGEETETTAEELDTASAPEGAELRGEQETTEAPEGEETTTEEAPAEEAPAAQALHPDLQAAIDEAKAAGNNGQAQLLKRVHKLVDQRDTERNARLAAEERARTAESRLAETPKGETRTVTANADPVLNHPEVKRVTAKLAEADQWLDWCDENPDGATLDDGKGGQTEFSAAQIAKYRRMLERQRTDLAAEKSQVTASVKQASQAAYQQQHTLAVKKFPWLSKPDSAESKEMKMILEAMPGLRHFPDHELVVGYYFKGRAADLAAAKAGGTRKPAPQREPTQVVTEAPVNGRPAKPNGKQQQEAAQQQFRTSGRTADLQRRLVRPIARGAREE